MRALFWIVLAAALGLYAIILLWSLPTVSTAAGGQASFDTRPVGYGFEEAKAFLAALSPAGRDFYLTVQHRLDLFFPPLMAVALGWSTLRLAPKARGLVRLLLVAPAALGAIFDLLENRAVTVLLTTPLDELTPAVVARASTFSQVKAALNTVAVLLLLSVAAAWLAQRLRSRGA